MQQAYGGYSGPDMQVDVDKKIYSPGDEVSVKINFLKQAEVVELLVLGDLTGVQIFHTIQTLDDQSIEIKFLLSESDEYERYLIRASGRGHNEFGIIAYYHPDIPIITKKGVDEIVIEDFTIDKTSVRPGESFTLNYKIKNGLGSGVFSAESTFALCKKQLQQSQSWSVITPEFLEDSEERKGPDGCVLLYRYANPSDSFSAKFQVPYSVEPGKYKVNLVVNEWPFENFDHKMLDLEIKEKSTINENVFLQVMSFIIAKNAPHNISYEVVSLGDRVKFYGYQVIQGRSILGNHDFDEFNKGMRGSGEPAFAGVEINVSVFDPYGKKILDQTRITDDDGYFEPIALDITDDLIRGVYEAFYTVTRDGIYIQPETGSGWLVDRFVVSNLQKFQIEAEGKPYEVYFQGVDLDASNVEFDQEKKLLSFDITKHEGKYYNNHYHRSTVTIGCPAIWIESPLLTGPFMIDFNEKQILACDGTNVGNYLVPGPINENGKLTITGTYVIPEFGIVPIILAISIIPVIFASKLKVRF